MPKARKVKSVPGLPKLTFEFDLGDIKDVPSILRDPTKPSSSVVRRGKVSWIDEESNAALFTRHDYSPERNSAGRKRRATTDEGTNFARRKDGDDDDDSEVMEVPVEDKTDVQAAKRAKKKPKEKANKDAPVVQVQEVSDDDGTLVICDSDSDDDKLLIDEGDDEIEEVVVSKKPKRLTPQEKRAKNQASIAETDRILEELKTIKTEDPDDELELLSSLVYRDGKVKPKKIRMKTKEQMQKEFDREMEAIKSGRPSASVFDDELDEIERMTNEWSDSFAKIQANLDLSDNYGDDENEDNDEESKRTKKTFEDMPELDDIMNDPIFAHLNRGKRRLDDDEKSKKDGKKKKWIERDGSDGEEKKVDKKKSGGKGGAKKKKHADGRAETEEEIMAEISAKNAESREKATRMKQQKMEDRERRKEELEKRKSDEKKEREEKRRMREEARERERRKKEEDERSLMDRKPKSRAEAARRTKKLLALGADGEGKNGTEDEDEAEPKRKRRKYRKRTKPVQFMRNVKMYEDEDGQHIGCGKYINNPNDVVVQKGYEIREEPDEEDWEEGDEDEILSVPFLWTSKEDQMSEGAIGPRNFDPDEHLKRHLNDVKEFEEGLSEEYHAMVKRLDGMKLNLFGDTTSRRFDSRVLHGIDLLSTVGMCTPDFLPQPNRVIPKFQYRTWFKDQTNQRLVRIRPFYKKKDQLTSKEIDIMSGGGANTVTKKDLVKNLKELVMSKLKKTSYTPLPNASNPYDVPEITTRGTAKNVADYKNASYVHKTSLTLIPWESEKKKRKRTRKEVLQEIANKPRPTAEENEDIYKEDAGRGLEEEYGGYQYEWDEMGEMMDNPMRDNHMDEDPFGGNVYDGLYDDDDDMDGGAGMDDDNYESEEETQLGEAFSFMAAHLG